MPRDVSNERQNAKVREVAERRAMRRRDALRAVMDDAQGRLWVRELIEGCGIFLGGYQPDGARQYFDAGQRNIGLALYAECLRDAPQSFRLMEDEAASRSKSDAREDAAALKELDGE